MSRSLKNILGGDRVLFEMGIIYAYPGMSRKISEIPGMFSEAHKRLPGERLQERQ